MEEVTVSEKIVSGQESQAEPEEVKKMEFNVDAKEFIPSFLYEPPNGLESWKADAERGKQGVMSKKIGEDYKPVFMDSVTEKFIQGPYLGNGRDPEIPYVRYFSKGQAIDFFNKKYFSADSGSGEVLFRSAGEGPETATAHDGPLLDKPSYHPENGFLQSNIFRPPIIDVLVQDILFRQRLAASYPKVLPLLPPPGAGRRGGKAQIYRASGRQHTEPKKESAMTQTPPYDVKSGWAYEDVEVKDTSKEENPLEEEKNDTFEETTTIIEVPLTNGMPAFTKDIDSESKINTKSKMLEKSTSPMRNAIVLDNPPADKTGNKKSPTSSKDNSPLSSPKPLGNCLSKTSSPIPNNGSPFSQTKSGSPSSSGNGSRGVSSSESDSPKSGSPPMFGIPISVSPSSCLTPFSEPPKEQRLKNRGKQVILITDALPSRTQSSEDLKTNHDVTGGNGSSNHFNGLSESDSPQWNAEEKIAENSGKKQEAITAYKEVSMIEYSVNGINMEDLIKVVEQSTEEPTKEDRVGKED